MEKKTLFIALLCVLLGGIKTNVFAQYNPIPILMNPPPNDPLGPGTGYSLQFSAWYSNDSLKIEVNNYLGNVEVHIYHENDKV